MEKFIKSGERDVNVLKKKSTRLGFFFFIFFISIILQTTNTFFFFLQLRNEKIFEANKLLERKEISVQDYLNRVMWNDKNLQKFFNDFESLDIFPTIDEFLPEEEDEVSSDEEEVVNTLNIESHACIVNESVQEELQEEKTDPTQCIYCEPPRKVTLVTSCGHMSCDECWNNWILAQNKILDNSDEPIRTIRLKRKNPKCMYCTSQTTHTTRLFWPTLN